MLSRFPWLTILFGACASPQVTKDDAVVDSDAAADCYPEGAVEPMAMNKVLWPYRWAKAIHGDGREAPLDLGFVPCAESEDIEWSPFDVLLFVSIPAW